MTASPEFPDGEQPASEQQAESEARKITEKECDILRIFTKSKALRRFGEDVTLLLAMMRDFTLGRYRKVPYRVVLATAFTLTYVLSVVDAIPDGIPVAGFLDDAALVALLLVWAEEEIEKYRRWRGAPKI